MRSAQELISWFWQDCRAPLEDYGLCQCQTEEVISKSENPRLMRAFLLIGVFIDQIMYTHFRSVYDDFRQQFKYPKLYWHPSGCTAMASPSWLIYSFHGFDKKIDWPKAEYAAQKLVAGLYSWFNKFDNSDTLINEFRNRMADEIGIEFKEQNQDKLKSVLLNEGTSHGRLE